MSEVFDPDFGFKAGRVVTTVDTDGLAITNTTLPGHVFHDGRIVRSIYQNEKGDWYAATQGFGNNRVSFANWFNQQKTIGGPRIFDRVNARMKRYIDNARGK